MFFGFDLCGWSLDDLDVARTCDVLIYVLVWFGIWLFVLVLWCLFMVGFGLGCGFGWDLVVFCAG